VTDADGESRKHNREVAHNESVRQTIGDIRVSVWAIALAVIIGLVALGWVFVRSH
jgi:hypothetical protein